MTLESSGKGNPGSGKQYRGRGSVAYNLLRTAGHLRRLYARLFRDREITQQQYNVLRILRGAGPQGLPTLDIVDRMIEHTPGITRLLGRLESKKLVRRERPADNRRQVLCYITKQGIELLGKLEKPMRSRAQAAVRMLSDREIDLLLDVLERIRGER